MITVVGIGADGWDGLAPASRRAIAAARVLIGSPRQLALVPDPIPMPEEPGAAADPAPTDPTPAVPAGPPAPTSAVPMPAVSTGSPAPTSAELTSAVMPTPAPAVPMPAVTLTPTPAEPTRAESSVDVPARSTPTPEGPGLAPDAVRSPRAAGAAAERIPLPSPLLPNLPPLLESLGDRDVCVLASGDPMFHGIGSTLVRLLGAGRVRVVPHVSSVSLACARLGWPVEQVDVVSAVGRPLAALRPALAPGRRVLVLGSSPEAVTQLLDKSGYAASRITTLSNLGAPTESVRPAPQTTTTDEVSSAGGSDPLVRADLADQAAFSGQAAPAEQAAPVDHAPIAGGVSSAGGSVSVVRADLADEAEADEVALSERPAPTVQGAPVDQAPIADRVSSADQVSSAGRSVPVGRADLADQVGSAEQATPTEQAALTGQVTAAGQVSSVDRTTPARLRVIAVECVPTPGTRPLPRTPGLPDEAYDHDGQLTKREVRAVVLSRLAPLPGQLLWDVGAGAGSVAIEWMRTHPSCAAVAVESHPERAARVRRNADALGVPALRVVEGGAPAALDGLPTPDAIFIGGGATAPGLIERCWSALRPGGRLVANAVTVETEAVLAHWYAELGGDLVRLAVQRAAPVGGFTGWRAAMPVTLWAVIRGDES